MSRFKSNLLDLASLSQSYPLVLQPQVLFVLFREKSRLFIAVKSTMATLRTFQSFQATHKPQNAIDDKLGARFLSPMLISKLHEHQKEAIIFLRQRLTCDLQSPSSTSSASNRDKENVSTVSHIYPGAILADDMGTGKTVISLAVMWSLCCELDTKGLIITPAGLVANWQAEMIKWMPPDMARLVTVLNSTCKGSNSKIMETAVNRFITSPASICPILILSYELYTSFVPALNTLGKAGLQCMICDEAHRLRTLNGSIAASLHSSVVLRRIAVSGTPLQNNLEEVRTLLTFIGHPLHDIQRGSVGSEHAQLTWLRNILKPVMLRRTAGSTPTITDSNEDTVQGGELKAKQVILLPPLRQLTLLIDPRHRTHSNVESNNDCDHASKDWVEKYDRLVQTGEWNETDSDTEHTSTTSTAFTTLSRARLLCSASRCPAKIAVVVRLLQAIRKTQPCAKIIVASPYTTSLATLKTALQSASMTERVVPLTIDGTVPVDKRMKIATVFNQPITAGNSANPFWLLLLSSRAGGVGLNLIGASHMILLDSDWNPAAEQQCIGRLWRQGQTAGEVVIYRMAIAGAVEQAMLGRQRVKRRLQSQLLASTDDSEAFSGCSSKQDRKRRRLTKTQYANNTEDSDSEHVNDEELSVQFEQEEDSVAEGGEDLQAMLLPPWQPTTGGEGEGQTLPRHAAVDMTADPILGPALHHVQGLKVTAYRLLSTNNS